MEIRKAVAADEMKPATLINLVHIALDNYNDIFSDFDPSPYSSRLLSDDFLKEIQKRYVENKKESFEVRFSLPAAERSAKTETIIKKRLKDYFSMRLRDINHEMKKQKKKGGIYLFAGFIVLSATIYIATYNINAEYYLKVPEILLVPLGWYMMWTGIERILESPAKLGDQRRFYEKFKKADYQFISEEEIVKQISVTAAKEEKKKPETKKGKPGEKKL